MAVIAKWMCDRDNSMFDTKKEADAYDKMLELAGQFTSLLESQVSGIDENMAEEFGILLAKNKDLLMQACKGNPEALQKIGSEDSNVTSISAEG